MTARPSDWPPEHQPLPGLQQHFLAPTDADRLEAAAQHLAEMRLRRTVRGLRLAPRPA